MQIIGGCCGTRPDHIGSLADIAKTLKPKERSVRQSLGYTTGTLDPRPTLNYQPAAASIYGAQPYDQDNSFLIIGERLNASGSKKVRELLNDEDWDGLVAIAKGQIKEGAHVLDVNVDYVGRDGERDMKELVSRLVTNVTLPLMLDSTEWTKMEAGLKVAGGKCILNSTNYEDGDDRFFKVLELAKTYGAGVVVGTIDEEGMARTAAQKFAIAQRAYRDALEYGIPAHELFYDPLALPISTGIEEDRANAKATVEAIQMIRENLPGVHITLGVSNISFGLSPAARITLNSVMLYECMQVGLDSAIVSAAKILPMAKIDEEQQKVCRDLIYDRRDFDENGICIYDPLTKLTQLFEGVSTQAARSSASLADLPIENRLTQHIIDGERIGLEDALKLGLEQYEPLHIINTFLLDGMKVVGELFGSGQMQLPFVLQSAETMKAAVAFLEPFMEKSETGSSNAKGKFLIATVKGDVHDIGKNLVDIILSNNGYEVINLGIKKPVEAIIQAYREHQPDCIAMSGLLVKSTAFMKENLAVFNEQGITVPVILGGAALTPKFVREDCQNTYRGQVIYGKDAFADLHFMDKLMPAKAQNRWDDRQGFLGEDAAAQEGEMPGETPDTPASDSVIANAEFVEKEQAAPVDFEDTERSSAVTLEIDRPIPPFWGTQILGPDDIPLEEVFTYLDLQALIVGQWQFRKPKEQSKEDYEAFIAETVHPILEQWKTRILEEKLLEPRLIYGYFPCQAVGNSLEVFHPDLMTETAPDLPNITKPLVTFHFPRQKSNRRLCIADFFAPKESGIIDVFPMQAVTVGQVATDYANKLFTSDQYTDYLYFHGMAVQTAEAMAEWVHTRIRRELGYGHLEPTTIRDILQQRYQGSRYSFGYSACPNVQDQHHQLGLLGADRIGLRMDESDQLEPEQSTTAIVAYHPAAKYFNT